MLRRTEKISKIRVFTALALCFQCLFLAMTFLPLSVEPEPETFRMLAMAYISVHLALLGVFGFLLSARGEPLLELSVNCVLALGIFVMYFSAGLRPVRFVPFAIYSPVVILLCLTILRRFSSGQRSMFRFLGRG